MNIKQITAKTFLLSLCIVIAGFFIAIAWLLKPQMASFAVNQKPADAVIEAYLLNNPNVLRDAIINIQNQNAVNPQQTRKENNRLGQQFLDNNPSAVFAGQNAIIAGNPQGDVDVVEFFDYNCGTCKALLPDVLTLTKEDKNIRLLLVEYPILGPGSDYAARAALAADRQGKYFEFHVALMQAQAQITKPTTLAIAERVGLDVARLQQDMRAPEIDAIIAQNRALANNLRLPGTPSFIIGTTLIDRVIRYPAMKTYIRELRAGSAS